MKMWLAVISNNDLVFHIFLMQKLGKLELWKNVVNHSDLFVHI